jgi:hypothetical protein
MSAAVISLLTHAAREIGVRRLSCSAQQRGRRSRAGQRGIGGWKQVAFAQAGRQLRQGCALRQFRGTEAVCFLNWRQQQAAAGGAPGGPRRPAACQSPPLQCNPSSCSYTAGRQAGRASMQTGRQVRPEQCTAEPQSIMILLGSPAGQSRQGSGVRSSRLAGGASYMRPHAERQRWH